jgi:hypothetical protein
VSRTPLQLVIEDSTETIGTYPPILAQASGTPTVRIGTPASGLDYSAAATNATVDSVSTTTNAAASEGSDSVALAGAVALVKGRRYLFTDATSGEVIPAIAQKGGSLSTFYAAEPFPRALASGSSLKGYFLSVALTADQTASSGPAIAEWTATLNGVSETWRESFRIVKSDGLYTLTSATLTDSSPYAKRMRGDTDEDYSEAIDAAWRRYVLPAIYAKGLRPERIASRELLEPVHIAAVEHFLAQQSEEDGDKRAEKRTEYGEALTLVLNSHELWVNPESEDVATPDPTAPREWTTVMVTR